MRTEAIFYLTIWTVPGLIGLVAALLLWRRTREDRQAAVAVADPLVAYMAKTAVTDKLGPVITQAIILGVAASSVASQHLAADTLGGVLARSGVLWGLELISVQLCAQSLYGLWTRHRADAIARDMGG
jgi:hypothetical protein